MDLHNGFLVSGFKSNYTASARSLLWTPPPHALNLVKAERSRR
jgi:hypothetical protein